MMSVDSAPPPEQPSVSASRLPPLPSLSPDHPPPPSRGLPSPRQVPLVVGAIWGIVYGVMLQLLLRAPGMKRFIELMSVGMVFLLPVAIGFLVVFYVGWKDRSQPLRWRYALMGPWSAIGPCLLLSFVVGWEGAFCLMFATPVFLLMSTLGGILAKLSLMFVERRTQRGSAQALRGGLSLLAIILLSPLTSGFVESNLAAPESIHRVLTEIDIAAPRQTVWSEIVRVRRISAAENSQGMFYKLGFPKPLEATLSHEGIGGVRHASFEKGLLFIETVTEWDPQHLLSFRIQADAHMTRLDPHVVVGGQYFDVLQGTYEIVPSARPDHVKLRLWSHFRLNTHFNGYAGFLGDSLMRDIQNSILHVVKRRCEARSQTAQ